MTITRKTTVIAFALVALLAVPSTLFAQAVENNQDEVVNVLAGGNPEGDDEILKIFRPSTKEESLNYVVEFLELKYANADEVAEYVDEAVGFEGGVSKALEYPDPKTGKLRYFLQVVTTAEQMPYVVKLVEGLDLPEMVESGGDPDFEVRMRYRRASEVGNILSQLGVDEIVADDLTNTLHFEDSESNLSLLDFYDVPPLQVQFEIKIVVQNNDDAGEIGLDWDAWKRAIGGEIQYFGNNLESARELNRLDWMLSLESNVLVNFLNYTLQTGTASVERRAVLNINNGSTGILSNSRNIPVYGDLNQASANDQIKSAEVDVNPDPTLLAGHARYEKVLLEQNQEGIGIAITPVIGTDLVTAEIVIEARTLNGFDEMDMPMITEQSFETAITLENNQELHVATIDRDVTVESRRGIPGLRAIPVLKHLFSTNVSRVESSRAYVVLTPCYCETVAYDARIKGGPGDVLIWKKSTGDRYEARDGK